MKHGAKALRAILWTLFFCVTAVGLLTTVYAMVGNGASSYPSITAAACFLGLVVNALWFFRIIINRNCSSGDGPRRRKNLVDAPPGARLKVLAAFVFSQKTMTSVIEPTLADMEYEYFEALRQGLPYKAKWVQCRGYWSFWSAVIAQLPISLAKRIYEIWRAAG